MNLHLKRDQGSLRESAAGEGAGKALGARGRTRYSISLQVQNETCRHSAVIFTMAEPQMEHPSARGSRLIVQRGMLMCSALMGSCSMETLSVRGFEI
ncbi:MAG: hypothetical protein ABS70_07730 [Nitrospira sp. SCN 59-13]|nr:MAG: hypothetical protein ABS70_07730 [Nitrospira sp. SCN 59-13]